jgi:Co/Zn/Cd efflux system component
MDPFMGLVGAALVIRWSLGLLRSSAGVLLDMQPPGDVREAIRKAIESEGDNRISDLHVWSVGPGIHAAEIEIRTSVPRDPDGYQGLLAGVPGLVHVTFEVHRCPGPEPGAG